MGSEIRENDDPERGLLFAICIGNAIVEDNGLVLNCTECHASPCPHTNELLREGLDGSYLHRFETFTVRPDSVHELLVFHRDDGMLYIELTPRDDKGNILLGLPTGRLTACAERMWPLICLGIGTIAPGEGRLVVRSLILNFIESLWFQLIPQERMCGRSSHDQKALAAIRNARAMFAEHQETDLLYAEMWAILVRGGCLTCCDYEDAASRDEDALSLVDSAASRHRWSWDESN